MAEETLRRNLDSAFDPGPDFPDSLLLSRTMAMLGADEATAGRGGRWKSRDRSRFSWPRPAMRLAAILLAVIVAVAATAAFLAVHRFFAPVPAHTVPFRLKAPGVGVCAQGTCLIGNPLFVSTEVGWLTESISPDSSLPCITTCAQTTVLFRTDDGGLKWKAQLTWHHSAGQILASSDGSEVLVVGAPYEPGAPLLHSVDGGVTWTSHGLPPGVGKASETDCKAGACSQVYLQPLTYFLNPREGWVLSQEQTYNIADLFHTADSGAHWILVAHIDIKAQFNVDVAAGLSYPSGVVSHSLPGQLVFQSPSVAWWFVPYNAFSPSPPYMYRSLDGGITWRLQKIQAPPGTGPSNSGFRTLKFFNDREAALELVVGQPKLNSEFTYVYATSDGGDHWSIPVQTPNVSYFVALGYIDAKHWVGWPAQGGWISTADGGQHWHVIPASPPGLVVVPNGGLPEFTAAPSWFDFVNPSQGWAYVYDHVSGGVALYETTDGGVNWIPSSLPQLT
jgi:photosystem II stability/assembly factor-like uncharacterized protein